MADLAITPTPPPTFHLFPQLYTELRLKIWAYAREARVVAVRYNPDSRKCHSPTPPPVLLHVNREARYETLRVYPFLFATPAAPSLLPFNPAIDTLYFPRHRVMGYDETLRDFRAFMARPADLDVVRRVALDSVESRIKRPWESYDKAVLIKSFPRLEQVLLVLERRRVAWLSNIPRPLGPVREVPAEESKETDIEFEEVEGAEALRVKEDFRMAFEREEEVLMGINMQMGKEYEVCKLPPVVVVTKKAGEGVWAMK